MSVTLADLLSDSLQSLWAELETLEATFKAASCPYSVETEEDCLAIDHMDAGEDWDYSEPSDLQVIRDALTRLAVYGLPDC